MAFCTRCGSNVPDGENFCPNCGAPITAPAAEPYQQQAYVNPGDHTAEISAEDIGRTKYLSALCYLSFLFGILGLLAEPNSKFLRYHLNQVLMLNVFLAICIVVNIIPFLGQIVSIVGLIMHAIFLIMGIVRACKGRAVDLPIVGKYTILHWN